MSNDTEFRLYAFHPTRPGPSSFFVMARSEQEARTAVKSSLKEDWQKGDREAFEFNEYELTVVGPGDVVDNSNM